MEYVTVKECGDVTTESVKSYPVTIGRLIREGYTLSLRRGVALSLEDLHTMGDAPGAPIVRVYRRGKVLHSNNLVSVDARGCYRLVVGGKLRALPAEMIRVEFIKWLQVTIPVIRAGGTMIGIGAQQRGEILRFIKLLDRPKRYNK